MFEWFHRWRLNRQLRDLNEITLEIETEEGTSTVTIPLDFSDFTAPEIERVGVLSQGADDLTMVACASLFVSASRRVDLDDEAFPSFREGILPMFAGDPSVIEWVGVDGL